MALNFFPGQREPQGASRGFWDGKRNLRGNGGGSRCSTLRSDSVEIGVCHDVLEKSPPESFIRCSTAQLGNESCLSRTTEKERNSVRRSIRRGRPFGDESWTKAMARQLALESTLRPRGRPRKSKLEDDEATEKTPDLLFPVGLMDDPARGIQVLGEHEQPRMVRRVEPFGRNRFRKAQRVFRSTDNRRCPDDSTEDRCQACMIEHRLFSARANRSLAAPGPTESNPASDHDLLSFSSLEFPLLLVSRTSTKW